MERIAQILATRRAAGRRRRLWDSVRQWRSLGRTAETIGSNLADLRSAGLLPPRDRRSGCVTLAPAAEWGIGVVTERRRVVAMGFRVDCQTVPGRGPVERSIESDSDPAEIFERAADAVRGVMADEWTGRLLGWGWLCPIASTTMAWDGRASPVCGAVSRVTAELVETGDHLGE